MANFLSIYCDSIVLGDYVISNNLYGTFFPIILTLLIYNYVILNTAHLFHQVGPKDTSPLEREVEGGES